MNEIAADLLRLWLKTEDGSRTLTNAEIDAMVGGRKEVVSCDCRECASEERR